MKTYWDFTDRERAEMTAEDVTRLLDFELMQKGVFKPRPLQLQPVEPANLETMPLFRVGREHSYLHVGFKTAEQARAFVALEPFSVENEYLNGKTISVARPIVGAKITAEDMARPESFDTKRAELKRLAAVEEANRQEELRYRKEQEAVEKATRGVWDDWQEQATKARDMKRVQETREEYERLCGGDKGLAWTFLAKAFPHETLESYLEWFGDKPPVSPPKLAGQTPADDIAF